CWLLNRLNTDRRADRSMPSTGSFQVTFASTFQVHGRSPKAPRGEYCSTRSSQAPSQFATHSQPDPPPLPSVAKEPAARVSSGQTTPNAVIGPPDCTRALAPNDHCSLTAYAPRSLNWWRKSLNSRP